MSRNDRFRLQRDCLREGGQPGAGIAFRQNAENAIDVDMVAGKQDRLLRQPDDCIAGKMGIGEIAQLDGASAQFQVGHIAR